MARIDRLGWADGLALRAFGARIGVRVSDPGMLARVREALPPGARPAASPIVDSLFSLWTPGGADRRGLRRYSVLYWGVSRVARSQEVEAVLRALEGYLQYGTAVGARRRIFVHAGVVGWRGRAMVIPGRSASGKTSLVVALLRLGATYYSDEFAVFDLRGRVHPYPRPLAIRQGAAAPRRCPASELGAAVGHTPLPLGWVVSTRYRAGARWRPRPLTPGEAVMALLQNTVQARARPELSLSILKAAALGAEAFRSPRGEAAAVAAALLAAS